MATSDQQPRQAGAPTIANVEQAAAWDGEEGDRWVEYSDRYEATAQGFSPRLLVAMKVWRTSGSSMVTPRSTRSKPSPSMSP
jgi:hypothetical protein